MKRKISSKEKVKILREVLENSRSVSEIAEENGINPNLIYRWKKQLFEGAEEIFKPNQNKKETKQELEIKKLKEKLSKKERAISYLVEDNIALKKSLGEY